MMVTTELLNVQHALNTATSIAQYNAAKREAERLPYGHAVSLIDTLIDTKLRIVRGAKAVA